MKKFLCILAAAVIFLTACSKQDIPTWQEQYDLGIRYLEEGNYEEAIIAFTAAIEIDPKQAPAYVGRADAYIGSSETEENLAAAMADYEAAIALDETLSTGWLGLADVYIRQEDFKKALEVLREALDKTGNDQRITDKIARIEGGGVADSEYDGATGSDEREPTVSGTGWQQAYMDFIEADTVDNMDLRSSAACGLIYIDDDEVPELYIDYGFTYAGGKICTYDGEKVVSLYTFSGGAFDYIERGSAFHISGGRQGVYSDYVYSIVNHEFVLEAEGGTSVQSWSPYEAVYAWNGREVTEAEYQTYLDETFHSSEAERFSLNNSYNYVDMFLVLDPITSISLDKTSLVMKVGETETIRLTTDIGGSCVTWQSSDHSVVTVDYATGNVTAEGVGSAVITATEEGSGNTAQCSVVVTGND